MKNNEKCICKLNDLQIETELDRQDNLNTENGHHQLVDLHINKNILGENLTEIHRETRHHHQLHGNRKYKAFRNHSSADDQPQVFTDLSPSRGRGY